MSDTDKKETKAKSEDKKETKTSKTVAKSAASDEKKDVKKAATEATPKVKAKAKAKDVTVSVTLKRSAIGRPQDQKATLAGLGFKRLNQTVVLKDTPQTRGMIRKVSHLVTVE